MTSFIIMRFPIFLIKFFCISIIFIAINTSSYAKKAAVVIDYETKKILFHINENSVPNNSFYTEKGVKKLVHLIKKYIS